MFTFEQLKTFLMENNEIECRQQIDGQNINDQQLPYETVAVPKMPKNQFFKEGNIFINKHHRYAEMPAHTHEFVEFNYMLSGSCVQYVNDKKIHLKEGELLLLDKEIVQRIDPLEEEDLLINILLKGESITTDIVINMVKSRGLVNEFLLNASQEKGKHDEFIHFHCGDNLEVQRRGESKMAFTFQINQDVRWKKDEALLTKAQQHVPNLLKTKIEPVAITEVVEDPHGLNGYSAINSDKEIKQLADYTLKRDEAIILDLGDHYVGHFSLSIDSVGSPMDAPLYLQLKFAEVPAELATDSSAYDGWLSRSWIQEEFIHLDVLPARLELPRRYSCRYIELKVLDTSPKWQASFSDPLFIAESCVSLDQLPKPVIADEELASIYQVSVKTLFDCMQEVFEDGPKRDRRLWIGDLRLQALANYATFGDLALTKRCLYLFGGMTTSEGKIPANVFTAPQLTPDDTFLFDYSLFFAVILADFYQQTKDSVVLQDLYPVAKKQMELALTCVDEEGRLNLLEEWPVFIDWSNEFEKSTAGQAVLIYAMKRFNQLAEQVKDPQLSHYQETTEKLIAFAKQQLFDEEQKQFIIETTGEINVASQVWMVLAEVFDQPMNREILETMIAHHFPITGIATPYMYHHVVEALFVAGLQEEAIQLMKNYWGKMIQLGADTFWEAFKPEEPDFSPYGSPIISSYCHAWSCTPAYLIEKYLN